MKTKSHINFLLRVVMLAGLLAQSGCSAADLAVRKLDNMRPLRQVNVAMNPTPFVPLPGDFIGGEAVPQQVNQDVVAAVPTTTPFPEPAIEFTPVPTQTREIAGHPYQYYTQAGDTLPALAVRFGVSVGEIQSQNTLTPDGLLDPGIPLVIPNRIGISSTATRFIPDSEIVFSPSALNFDIEQYVNAANGYLSRYKELRANGRDDSASAIRLAALENSINPRLLLAILQYQSGWVHGEPYDSSRINYPISPSATNKEGLYPQLSWAVQMLNLGYYGWRNGRFNELTFTDGSILRLAPDLNAGTVAVMYLFSRIYDLQTWNAVMFGNNSFPAIYSLMFGDPWERANAVEPLFPATLSQPELELPFQPGVPWSLTGGPHSAWAKDGALAAIDLAPSASKPGCYNSDQWVTAVASGIVSRVDTGVVVVDLDGDGYEQTGWNILYLHIATRDKLKVGDWVNVNERIGHPSCEGGLSTGTHLHLARKYNGEWIEADGPIPMVLSGWTVHYDGTPYMGRLTKDGAIIESSLYGEFKSLVRR